MDPTAERNYSKLEWILYIIILPLIFVSILTITLLWFLNVDFKDNLLMNLNEKPFIGNIIDDEQFEKTYDSSKIENKDELLATLNEYKNSLNEKNDQLTKKDSEILALNEQVTELNKQIEELQSQLNEKSVSDKSREEEIANLAKIYSAMSAKNAAGIIANLSNEEAVLILDKMNNEAKSQILEKMDPVKAAELSKLMLQQ